MDGWRGRAVTLSQAIVGHAHAASGAASFVPLTAVWLLMMGLMMAPTAWPWVLAFDRFAGEGSRVQRRWATATFTGGYLAAWGVFAIVAATLQLAWTRLAWLDEQQRTPPMAGAAILIIAGLYQCSTVKSACLTHCRNPFSYLLARWSNAPASGFRLGFGHGLFCVGCCWALMTTVFAVGVMNLWWMAALTCVVFLEQVLPRGDRLRAPLGVALVAAGSLRAFGA
jgi:predicted metal-binding membrane protein